MAQCDLCEVASVLVAVIAALWLGHVNCTIESVLEHGNEIAKANCSCTLTSIALHAMLCWSALSLCMQLVLSAHFILTGWYSPSGMAICVLERRAAQLAPINFAMFGIQHQTGRSLQTFLLHTQLGRTAWPVGCF
jgi:hypothetical protein